MTDALTTRIDRLYELLPAVHRQRDIAHRLALRDLLRVIAEQVTAIEDDLFTMYDDWFIETCRGWVVPYIGDLVGYQATQQTGALVPRRDVANDIRDLRRRGTLALLENLAADSAGLPSRAVEFFTLLGRTQSLNHLDRRGRLLDVRDGESLDLIDSPFDRAAHIVDVRGVTAPRLPGRHNLPSAGAYVWRLRAYQVSDAPAVFVQQRSGGYAFYTFSILGNDAPLFTSARRERDSTTIADEINVPSPIRRRALELHRDDYYGAANSFAIWLDDADEPVPAEHIVSADLTDWKYRPRDGQVVVDPALGRFVLAREARAVRVSYRYGFSGDVGAHQSPRTLVQPSHAALYRVGRDEEYQQLAAAIAQWTHDQGTPHPPVNAVIEIADNDLYNERLGDIALPSGCSLQIRAANRCRPAVRVLDYDVSRGERLTIALHDRARFTLDGIMLAGRPLRLEAAGDAPVAARVTVRRCTLVPGWDLHHDCEPGAPNEASIEIDGVGGWLTIDRSIVGSLAVAAASTAAEPIAILIRDSIIDATSSEIEAIAGPNAGYAWAAVSVVRSTVIGQLLAHALTLGEDAIFHGLVRIVRQQQGCVRFSYVTPGSRTPRRYHCQPDLAVSRVDDAQADQERRRVAPRFTSLRFGDPAYGQLARHGADEITRGAQDESEMGAFHDLFLPQRVAGLRARLAASTPAGMETGIIYAD